MTPYAVIAAGFGAVFAVMVLVELLARRDFGGWRTVGEAAHAALLLGLGRWRTAGRWLVLLGWLWAGFHLLAR